MAEEKKKQSRGSGGERIVATNIVPEMRESYLDYAMSVIVSRALPDVRDGLKPVHRRILYAMHELGLTNQAKFRKSAAVVGDVLGKYHPHGDTSVYDAMVKMAQDFYMRYPLVEGQGNFGSIDGDSAAAMRYCITGDSLVVTNKGLFPIEKISETSSEDIDIKILSKDQIVNKASKWFDSGEHPTVKITTNKGYAIQGSQNHPLLVWTRDSVTKEPRFEWKLLENIKIGDVVAIDRTVDTLWPTRKVNLKKYVPQRISGRQEVKVLPKELNEDLAHILGVLISEGTIKEREIEFCNSDERWIEEFAARWKRVFPDCRLHHFSRKANSYGKKPYQTIEVHSTYVIAFLRNIGLIPVKSAQKRIPESILRSPKSVVSEFLRAYYEGDGSISFSSTMTELSAISKSERLISELQVLLLRYGVASAKRLDTYGDIHKLYIRGLESYSLFEKNIGFVSERKSAKLKQSIGRLSKNITTTDFIPFLSEYIRNKKLDFVSAHLRGDYAAHYNFDRYQNLKKRHGTISSAVVVSEREIIKSMFEKLLHSKYLFEPITKIEDGGVQKVYSVRVDSECHSFVSNGFISHNTEARMSKLSSELLRDIEKETVDFAPNYDSTRTEPTVLPSAIPNLLLNGTVGIAVGMASKIPPHNLRELIGALIHLIEHRDATTEDLLEYVKGPDFPTGGVVFNRADIHHAYATGRGGVVVRGEAEITETKTGSYQILISSLPYQVNKAEMITDIADQVREKKLEGVRDIRDESTKETRVVIELKQGVNPQKVLNYLYKHSPLETTFNYNTVALVDGVPRTLSLVSILEEFLSYRQEVVTRRAKHDLTKAEDREHILSGLKKALDHIDEVIKTIKASKDTPTAQINLMKKFELSDRQAAAILDMRLQKLAGLERKKIEDELEEVRKLIIYLKDLLAHPEKILAVIKTEFEEIAERYGDERKTKVMKHGVKEITEEDLIPEAENVLVLTAGGYVKRTDPAEYRAQRRGGIGVVDLDIKEEDFITNFLTANTHDDLLFFTDAGKAYQIKMYDLAEGKRATRGKSIMNFISLGAEERVTSILPMPKAAKQKDVSLVMVTRGGTVKKVGAESFRDVRRNGLIAIRLDDGDQLLAAFFAEKGDTVILATAAGQSIRFKESDVREMGRAAGGVRGISLKKKDAVVGAEVVNKDVEKATFMIMSENGYGKRTKISEYKVQKRAGSGIKTANVTAKTGTIMVARVVGVGASELIAISKNGQVIRTGVVEVPVLGRSTQGVRIMKLREKDAIASLTLL